MSARETLPDRCSRTLPPGALPAVVGALALSWGGCAREAPGTGSGAAGERAAAADWLVCDEPQVDFGEVLEGTVLEHEFLLENRGTQEVEFVSLKADCGCTAAAVAHVDPLGQERRPLRDGARIQPGERIAVAVTYHTSGRVGATPRELRLFNSQPSGVTRLGIEAVVRPWLVVEPAQSPALVLREGESQEVELTVKSAGGEPFLLAHSGQGVPDQVRVETRAVDPDRDGRSAVWSVRTLVQGGLPRGIYNWPIHLLTDVENPDQKAGAEGRRAVLGCSPFVSARVVGWIGVAPASMSFVGLVEGQSMSRVVRLTCYDPEHRLGEPRVRLEPEREGAPVPTETAHISTRAVPGENAWDVQLLLSGLPPEVGGWLSAKLVIETDHPAEPQIEVRVGARRQGDTGR